LMDAFFACLPVQHKRRMHFHQFMHEVHTRLASLQGQPDPLTSLAQEIAQQVRVLCLDEFVIHDIADAMLMRGLLSELIQQGVVLIITSNTEPAALYAGGLQFNQFSPCIALITSSLAVVHVDGGQDYRRSTLAQTEVYHTPLNQATDTKLAVIFHALTSSECVQNVQLTINARLISARYQAADVAWFEFAELCVNPCGSADYRVLAARFHTIMLSGVPQFDAESITSARRFLWLVDALYDARVKLILSAAVPLAQLAQGDLFSGEFERALSRLAEMQSQAYLSGHALT
ncbi:MAG: cell division protein ZapE, partial [Sulfuriferula sp.]